MIRYIGIDPGTHTAIVILREDGSLHSIGTVNKPGHSKANPETWQQWAVALRALSGWLTTRLVTGDCIVILANPINRKAVITYGETLGVVSMVALVKECTLQEARDKHVKAVMCGHGKATKEEMIAKARELWPGVEFDEHMADAALSAESVRRGL